MTEKSKKDIITGHFPVKELEKQIEELKAEIEADDRSLKEHYRKSINWNNA